jgi:hypothetical protein
MEVIKKLFPVNMVKWVLGRVPYTISVFLLCNLFLLQDGRTFIVCSLVVRALEGLGNAAFLTSSFSLVAQLFTNSVATVFALGKEFW